MAWENTPTISNFVQGISEYLQASYHEAFVETRHTTKLESWNTTSFDITCIVLLTAVLSTLRHILDKYVSMPLTRYFDIPEESRKKVPEHLWRFIYFLSIWCYEWYVVVLKGKNKFLQNPETMWHGWSLKTPPSGDIYCITIIQIAFYLHWTYTTIFLDIWRKYSAVMVLHHVVVLFLLFLGKAIHWHNLGVLAFFLHDMCDFFFDFSKLCWLFRIQSHTVRNWIEIIGYVAFACGLPIWCLCRLYWFSLKVVYSGAVHPLSFNLPLNIPFGFLMNLLLWIQLILNFYWFTKMINGLYRIVTFKVKSPADYDRVKK